MVHKHYIIALVVVLSVITGCVERLQKCELTSVIAGGQVLGSGDILLARCSGFLPAVFAGLGKPESDYGHAAVFFHDENGCGRIMHMQPSGVVVNTVGEFKKKYFKIGLVRIAEAVDLDRHEFDRQCHLFLAYNKVHKVCSDFWSESGANKIYVAKEYPEYIYCLTLINMLFYRSGAPEPFAKRFDLSTSPIIKFIGKALGRKNYIMPAVASILSNTNYIFVEEYLISTEMIKTMQIDNALVTSVDRYLAGKYTVSGVPVVQRPVLAALYGAKLMLTPFLPKGTRAMVQRIDSLEKLAALYMMNRYIKTVREEVLLSLQTDSGVDISCETGKIADRFRDKYFQEIEE